MRTVEEYRVNLPGEADVAVVECLLFLLQQAAELFHLLLKHDYFLAEESVVFPPNVHIAAAVDGEIGGDGAHDATCRRRRRPVPLD